MKQNDDPISDLLNRIGQRQRGRKGMPPGAPKPAHIVAGVLVALALWAALTSFYTVQPEERAVVKRFGAVDRVTNPGLHFKLPFGIDSVQLVATERVLKQEFGFRTEESAGFERTQFRGPIPDESQMLTGDLNIIEVEWVVQYRIQDPIKFLYAMRDPTQTLRDLSESVMRRVVGNRIGSEVLTTARVDIASTARTEIQEAMNEYDNGIEIITIEMQDVVPPERVQPAFNEVNEARQERERMINEANRQANQAIPRAEGSAERVVSEAEGYAMQRVNRALGETSRFTALLQEYRGVPEVTRSRLYLETLNETLPRIGSVLVLQEDVPPLPLLDLGGRRPLQTQEEPFETVPTPDEETEQQQAQAPREARNIGRSR